MSYPEKVTCSDGICSVRTERNLGIFSLAALLVSIHYGMGFMLGTAEKAFSLGWAGSLYAMSIGGGILALLWVAPFYWQEIDQIWTLFGERYGPVSKRLVGVMSWLSLIGIGAAQLISGSFILRTLHLPVVPGLIGLTLGCGVVSLLPVEKASWIFRGLLLINIGVLLYGVWILGGFPAYVQAPVDFWPALDQLQPVQILGVVLPTVLLVSIDMRCQQVVVQARDRGQLWWGCVVAAGLFVLLALLPSALIGAAQGAGILPEEVGSKEALLYTLAWIGGGLDRPLGIGLVGVLLVPALGAGSGVLRTQTQAAVDFLQILSQPRANRILWVGINASLCLAIALKGREIVDLIVCFYGVYVGSVWVPFMAYWAQRTERFPFAPSSVRRSLLLGSLASMAGLLITLFFPSRSIWQSDVLTILVGGGGVGLLTLMVNQGIAMVRSVPAAEDETIQEEGLS